MSFMDKMKDLVGIGDEYDDEMEVSQEEIDAMDRKILEEELDKLTEKSYETTVPMKLKKVEGEWKVAKMEDDSEFMNAILGRHHQSV